MPLEDGDVLLLCSDGIGGVLSEAEITECLSLTDANGACEALQSRVLEKNLIHQDNFTGVVIRCNK
jgi:protein phosphatase